MFTGNPVDTTRAEPKGGIIPRFTASSLCACPKRQDFFKGTSSRPTGRRRGINISGVDFWHAVEFSRNGRFLCTHPLGLSSGLFPSVLRFRLYQTVSRSDFLGAFQVPAFAFAFPAAPTLSDPFGPDPQSAGFAFAAVGPFRRLKL